MKLDGKSQNIVQRNIEKLKELFPNIISDGKVDFDMLKAILGENIELNNEKYGMNWVGKYNTIKFSQSPSTGTLIPCKEISKNWDTTQNLYIEGDNIEVLKLLQKTYFGKVKVIYIDPPYNTGHDFIYNDDFKNSIENYKKITSQTLRANPNSSGRFHTDWLNMMYSRLSLARNLLKEDGVIFISIDDNELDNLKKICDEIFGEFNHQATITYVRKTSGKQDSTNFMKSTEYILVYSKSETWICNELLAEENVLNRYNKVDLDGRKYRETDLRKTGSGDRRADRPLMWYPFYYNPHSEELVVSEIKNEDLVKEGWIEIFPIKPDGSEGRWRWGYSTSVQNIGNLVARIMPKYKDENKYTIYEKDYLDKNGEIRTVKEHTSWDRKEFNSDNAMLEFKNLGFSNQLFPFPKSSALIKHILYLAKCENEIVLDFFSGSATTAQAVLQLNSEDGGNRKFIMVQLPELCEEGSEAYKNGYKNICEIGEERIRRAGQKIYDELREKYDNAGLLTNDCINPDSLDIGFKVFKLDSTNIKPWDGDNRLNDNTIFDFSETIKENRTNLDVAYEIILKYGIFNMPLNEIEINNKTMYSIGEGFMIICLDNKITLEDVAEIAKLNPHCVVFKEEGFEDDNIKINATYTLERLGVEDVKCI